MVFFIAGQWINATKTCCTGGETQLLQSACKYANLQPCALQPYFARLFTSMLQETQPADRLAAFCATILRLVAAQVSRNPAVAWLIVLWTGRHKRVSTYIFCSIVQTSRMSTARKYTVGQARLATATMESPGAVHKVSGSACQYSGPCTCSATMPDLL